MGGVWGAMEGRVIDATLMPGHGPLLRLAPSHFTPLLLSLSLPQSPSTPRSNTSLCHTTPLSPPSPPLLSLSLSLSPPPLPLTPRPPARLVRPSLTYPHLTPPTTLTTSPSHIPTPYSHTTHLFSLITIHRPPARLVRPAPGGPPHRRPRHHPRALPLPPTGGLRSERVTEPIPARQAQPQRHLLQHRGGHGGGHHGESVGGEQ